MTHRAYPASAPAPTGNAGTGRKRRPAAARKARRASWLAAGAAALVGAAVFNRWSAAKAERDCPPAGRFVIVNGVRLHYVERGSGPAVVMIPGNGSLTGDFTASGLVDRLADDHRVLVFDRPGFGFSERPRDRIWNAGSQADIIASACDQLGIVRPIVFGHSWGTLVALAWALARPGEIAALVLASGYYYPGVRADTLMGVLSVPVLGDIFNHTVAPLQARLTGPLGNKLVFAPAEVAETYLRGFPFGLALRPSQLRATTADTGLMVPSVMAMVERYAALELPVTVIWGDGDKLIDPDKQSARLARDLPNARAVIIADAGHMVQHIDPARVAAEIAAAASDVQRPATNDMDALVHHLRRGGVREDRSHQLELG